MTTTYLGTTDVKNHWQHLVEFISTNPMVQFLRICHKTLQIPAFADKLNLSPMQTAKENVIQHAKVLFLSGDTVFCLS